MAESKRQLGLFKKKASATSLSSVLGTYCDLTVKLKQVRELLIAMTVDSTGILDPNFSVRLTRFGDVEIGREESDRLATLSTRAALVLLDWLTYYKPVLCRFAEGKEIADGD